MIAEDSHTIRKLIQNHLEGAGYTVTSVCDGQAAWEAIEGRAAADEPQFDLLISDIEMPRMDGLYLTRKIKGTKQLSHIPVILFSSLITPDNLKKGQAVGADLQISKPAVHQISQFADQLLAKGDQVVQQAGATF